MLFRSLITGLNNNQADQQPLRLEILKSRIDPLALGTYSFSEGSGFSVSDGKVQKATWTGLLDSQDTYRRLFFWESRDWRVTMADLKKNPPPPPVPPIILDPIWIDGVLTTPICSCNVNVTFEYSGSPVLFEPVSGGIQGQAPPLTHSTPGPLPIFGAAASYGVSRRLRRRIRAGKASHTM